MAATSFWNLEAPFDTLGEGIIQVVDVYPVDERPAFAYEEAPGAAFGCKVTEFTPAQLAAPPVNMGTLSYTIENGPAYPDCVFVDGVGYECIGAEGTGGEIAAGAMPPLFTLTNNNVTFSTDLIGLKIRITGATGGNNGLFNVVNVMGDNTIVYANPNGAPENNVDLKFKVLAGFGPAGQADPIPDDARIITSLSAGGNGTFTDFETNVDIGDSFTMDDDTQALLDNIPLDGSAFTLSCEGTGGECGSAMATGLIIQTTDANVSMLPPFVLPPPENKAVRIFCLRPASGTVPVPAEASAFLMNSGATRIRALLVRATPGDVIQPDGDLDNVAGHAWAGFTQVP